MNVMSLAATVVIILFGVKRLIVANNFRVKRLNVIFDSIFTKILACFDSFS